MGDLTDNFSRDEFRCPCCGKDRISIPLVVALQDLRDHLGQPIHPTSGYRCKKHNAEVHGSPGSQHVLGRAADIIVKGVELCEIYALAETRRFGNGGIGLYPQEKFVHLDLRGYKARWGRIDRETVSIGEALKRCCACHG